MDKHFEQDPRLGTSELKSVPNLHTEHFNITKLHAWLHKSDRQDVYQVNMHKLKELKYVTFTEFLQKLKEVNKGVPKQPYGLIVDHEVGKSKYWAYTLLKDQIKPPQAILYTGADHDKVMPAVLKKHNISNFLLIDDASYSGSQNWSCITKILMGCAQAGIKNPNIQINIPYVTNNAAKRMLGQVEQTFGIINPTIRVTSLVTIPTLGEILSPQEKKILKSVNKNYGEKVYLNETLTYFEHRRPDIWSFDVDLGDCMNKGLDRPYRTDQKHLAQEMAFYQELL